MFGPSLEVDGPTEGVVDLVRGGWRQWRGSSQAGYLYIYFTTAELTTDSQTNTAEIINTLKHLQTVPSLQSTQSVKMFPPVPPVIFDYLMLNTPSDARGPDQQ